MIKCHQALFLLVVDVSTKQITGDDHDLTMTKTMMT